MDMSNRFVKRSVALVAAAIVSQRVDSRSDHSPLTIIDTAKRFVEFLERG